MKKFLTMLMVPAFFLMLMVSPAISAPTVPLILSAGIGSYHKTGDIPPDFKSVRRETILTDTGKLTWLDIFRKGQPLPMLDVGALHLQHVQDGKATVSQVYMDFREIFYKCGVRTAAPVEALLPIVRPATWLDVAYNADPGFLRFNCGTATHRVQGAFPLKEGEVAILWLPADGYWQAFLMDISKKIGGD